MDGYVMIDCKGIDLSTLGTVSGIYNKIKTAIGTGKPIILSGIVNGEQGFTPISAFGGVESATSVFLSFFPVTIHISNEDEITM